MTTLKIAIGLAWVLFRLYWLVAAARTKKGSIGVREILLVLVAVAIVLLLSRLVRTSLDVHSGPLIVLGAVITACGFAIAVWARVHLGDSWGLPMTSQEEAALITTGPYRFIRHPIYAGIFLALVGTGLAINLIVLAIAAVAAIFGVVSSRVEERNLEAAFPGTYEAYVGRTKMLIPFVV